MTHETATRKGAVAAAARKAADRQGKARRRLREIRDVLAFRRAHRVPVGDPESIAVVLADCIAGIGPVPDIEGLRAEIGPVDRLTDGMLARAIDRVEDAVERSGFANFQIMRNGRAGRLVDVTAEEAMLVGISTMTTQDETRDERKARQVEQNRVREREAKRVKRDRERARKAAEAEADPDRAERRASLDAWLATGRSRKSWLNANPGGLGLRKRSPKVTACKMADTVIPVYVPDVVPGSGIRTADPYKDRDVADALIPDATEPEPDGAAVHEDRAPDPAIIELRATVERLIRERDEAKRERDDALALADEQRRMREDVVTEIFGHRDQLWAELHAERRTVAMLRRALAIRTELAEARAADPETARMIDEGRRPAIVVPLTTLPSGRRTVRFADVPPPDRADPPLKLVG